MNFIAPQTQTVPAVLLDARNFDTLSPALAVKLQAASLAGLDIETEDSGRHPGLSAFMRTDDDGRKAGNRPLVFDVNRTVVCGISIYPDGDDRAYYINLNHADVENRVPWPKVKKLLDAINAKGCWIAHNAAFERVMLFKSLGWEPTVPIICTMQMAVSAYSPDEYEIQDFRELSIEPLKLLLKDASATFLAFDPKGQMTGAQGELFAKFVGKESDAAHSYNGWVGEISRPYDLKRCIKYWFGFQMATFEETLGGNIHMGQLTGEQVADYGADDAYWAVRLYHRLLQHMIETNPAAVRAFFEQELPCVEYYADVWAKGMRINGPAVIEKRIEERGSYANTLRRMKAAIRGLLPFPTEPSESLAKYDGRPAENGKKAGWYYNGCNNYRSLITRWANKPDEAEDFYETQHIQGAISNAWAEEVGNQKPPRITVEEQVFEEAKKLFDDREAEVEAAENLFKLAKGNTTEAKKAFKEVEARRKTVFKDTSTSEETRKMVLLQEADAKALLDRCERHQKAAKEALDNHEKAFNRATELIEVKEKKKAAEAVKGTLSIGHYMPVRVLLYDLMREKVIIDKGKVQSDGEARGKLVDRLEKKLKEGEGEKARLQHGLDLLKCMGELAGVEQRAKLYLNPYAQLVDPVTQHVYPIISSKLASRRTSISTPNGQQLAKRGESTYVRGFYLADHDDHVILSEDWSGIELVLIGEFSQDPEFRKAFGQLPYQDLHLGATASCLSVVWGEELTQNIEKQWSHFERYGITNHELTSTVTLMEWFLKQLKSMTVEDIQRAHPRMLINLKGEMMDAAKALKYWRTEVGKAANFGYWYSGALSDVGQRLGWSSDQMWKAVEAYRERFSVAERWRTDTIMFGQQHGYIELPDGHRRSRFESTHQWNELFMQKFSHLSNSEGIQNFLRQAARAVQRRANNQVVNSMIQGSCATMMKRSIIRLRAAIKAAGYTDREMRVLIPIHDELLLSVHKDLVVEAIKLCREAMCFPDIVKTLPLTVAPAIGRTFEPFKGNRLGQIELAELSKVPCLPKERWDQEATDDEIKQVVQWIFEKEAA